MLAISGGTIDTATLITWISTGSVDLVLGNLLGPGERQFLDDGIGYEIAVEWDTMLDLLLFEVDDTRF